jgi:hypothetical protein
MMMMMVIAILDIARSIHEKNVRLSIFTIEGQRQLWTPGIDVNIA